MVPPGLEVLLVGLVALLLPELHGRAAGAVAARVAVAVPLEVLPGALRAPAREVVVRVRGGVPVQGEELSELLLGHRRLLQHALAVDHVLQRLLGELPLEYLLLDRAGREQPVQVALLLLPVPPAPRRGLLVVGRVPVRVEQHQPVTADEVDAAPAGFAAQQKREAVLARVVELLHQLLSFRDARRAVEPNRGVAVLAAQQLHQVQRLRVVGDDHDPVLGLGAKNREQTRQHGELAAVELPALHHTAAFRSAEPAARPDVVHARLEELAAALEPGGARAGVLSAHHHVVDELRVVAQLLQGGDRGEHHGVLARQRRLRGFRLQEVRVQARL